MNTNFNNKTILVTGGTGSFGKKFIRYVLNNYNVKKILVFSRDEFKQFHMKDEFNSNNKLRFLIGDVRDEKRLEFACRDVDVIIHLANVANDPAVELNPTMSWEINVLAGQQLIDKAKRANIKQFIFASSGSVYGVKKEDQVTEDLSLVPISTYNKTKMVAERVFMSYSPYMKVHCVRPATVCGYSERMRLDVAVNLLTMQALEKGVITVLGGNQIRPNIHIDDITDLYLFFIGISYLFSALPFLLVIIQLLNNTASRGILSLPGWYPKSK